VFPGKPHTASKSKTTLYLRVLNVCDIRVVCYLTVQICKKSFDEPWRSHYLSLGEASFWKKDTKDSFLLMQRSSEGAALKTGNIHKTQGNILTQRCKIGISK